MKLILVVLSLQVWCIVKLFKRTELEVIWLNCYQVDEGTLYRQISMSFSLWKWVWRLNLSLLQTNLDHDILKSGGLKFPPGCLSSCNIPTKRLIDIVHCLKSLLKKITWRADSVHPSPLLAFNCMIWLLVHSALATLAKSHCSRLHNRVPFAFAHQRCMYFWKYLQVANSVLICNLNGQILDWALSSRLHRFPLLTFCTSSLPTLPVSIIFQVRDLKHSICKLRATLSQFL